MASFLNTEQTYSSSGVSATFLAPNVAFSTILVSGGLNNVAGPVVVKAIWATTASGFTGADSSGQRLIVCDAVSGATSGAKTAGQVLYFYHAGGVAISGAVVTAQPPVLTGIDFLARSGLSIFVTNSGSTHAYDVNVLYASKQA